MDGLELSLPLIARHGTFLLLVLPVVGAMLVVLSAPWGREIVLRTALTNAGIAIAVALLMLIAFDPSPTTGKDAADHVPRMQMASSSDLEGGADSEATASERPGRSPARAILLRIDVGVDGISLWFVVLMPLVALAAIIHARHERHLTALLAMLLLLQASLTGLFAALNVVQFVVCLEASTLLLVLLIGRWGGPEHRREVVPMAAFQLTGSLLVFFGLMMMVVSHAWLTGLTVPKGTPPTFNFSLVALVGELPLLAGEDSPRSAYPGWNSAEAIIFWSLLVGFAIKSAVFPFHRGSCSASGAWPACVGVFAYGVFPCVGIYSFLRTAVPVCEHALATNSSSLIVLLLLGSIYCAMLALAQSELKRTLAYVSVAHTGLAFATALSRSASGISGAMFHLIGHVAAFSLLVAVVAAIERRYATLEIRAFGGLSGRLPRVAAAFFVAVFALCGLPGLSGFPAVWQTLIGLLQGPDLKQPSLLNGMMSLLVVGLLAWTFLRTGQRIFWGSRREPLQDDGFFMPPGAAPPKGIRDWGPPERIVATLMAAVLLAVGLAPQFVADRVVPKTGSGVEGGKRKAEGGKRRDQRSEVRDRRSERVSNSSDIRPPTSDAAFRFPLSAFLSREGRPQ
jgi:NADH-quinone oxidoreductase subunit M